MPRCCPSTEVVFSNATTTQITYDQVMKDKYGSQPHVFVYYYDPVTTELYLSPFFTVMKFNGTTITIDHGGPNSGIVVIK